MSNLNNQLGADLERLRVAGLYGTLRAVESAQGPRIVIDGRELLNFSSNDYLGLANDPILKRAAAEAIDRYGVGSGASRLVCGNLQPYEELERKLAAFKGREAALVFSSGYAANVGVITALVGEGDVVILDKLDHASIIDGARQSGATIRVYPHKNVKKLEEILQWAAGRGGDAAPTSLKDTRPPVGAASPPRSSRVLIITETVFSMDGDLAPLAEIVALKEEYGAWLMIDEAHATGLYGQNRRGLAEPLGLEDKIEVTVGTLSKALGCAGGFVVGSQVLIDYLRNRARSLIYSTALPPAVCAAGAAAVDFVMSDKGHERRDQLWRNVSELKNGLSKLGIQNESRSPIIPIIVGEESAAVRMSAALYDGGIFVPAIRYPTVPKGKARLRVTVTAAHCAEDIRAFLEALGDVGAASPPRPGDPLATHETGDAASSPLSVEPHSRALRRGRASVAGDCYFLTTCVEGKRSVFESRPAARMVIDSLLWLRNDGKIRLLGFVVMPDHAHVALALEENWTLEAVMQAFKSFTSHEICRRLGVAAPLWQNGYHDHRLRDKSDFLRKLQYMHENPSRKGLVNHVSEYPFSTAHPDYASEIDWLWYEGIKT